MIAIPKQRKEYHCCLDDHMDKVLDRFGVDLVVGCCAVYVPGLGVFLVAQCVAVPPVERVEIKGLGGNTADLTEGHRETEGWEVLKSSCHCSDVTMGHLLI